MTKNIKLKQIGADTGNNHKFPAKLSMKGEGLKDPLNVYNV